MCVNLKNIVIPDSVTSIGAGAFDQCEGLESVVLPSNLIAIEDETFVYCYNLKNIVIPNKVATIGNFAFWSCSRLTEVIFEEESKVELIGKYAFGDCPLTNIAIPKSIHTISNSAFSYNYSLEDIKLPEGLVSIGEYAFSQCYALESILIPSSVTNIGEGAFSDCDFLERIDVDQDNEAYISEDGVLYNKDKTILMQYPSRKPGGIFEIPNTVEIISDKACMNAEYLEKVIIPESLVEIGHSAFASSKKLEKVVFPTVSNIEIIGESAFNNCESLKTITIPNSVSGIENYAFYGCESLENLEFQEASIVEIIGYSAFSYCSNLTEVILPNSVKDLGDYAFYHCDNIKSVVLSESMSVINYNTFGECENLESVVIPDNIEIKNNAFSYCSNLNSIEIGKGVIIDLSAFPSQDFNNAYATYGAGKYVKSSGEWEKIMDGLDAVIYGMLQVGKQLGALVTPINAVNVTYQWQANTGEDGTYEDIDGATEETFIIPADLAGCMIQVVVEGYGFVGTSEPVGMIESPESDFYGEAGVARIYEGNSEVVVIPSVIGKQYVTRIISTFSAEEANCENIKKIVIPSTVTEIEEGAFSGCPNLEIIEVNEDNLHYQVIDGALYDNRKTSLLSYPAKRTDTEFIVPASVITIGEGAFKDNKNLEELTFEEGSGLTRIGEFAFLYCSRLVNVELPTNADEKVFVSIGKGAFAECTWLENIVFPYFADIGDQVLGGCYSLRSITLGIAEIGTGFVPDYYDFVSEVYNYTPGTYVNDIGGWKRQAPPQTLSDAKEAIERIVDLIDNDRFDNDTIDEDILDILWDFIENEDIGIDIEDYILTRATVEEAGSITGTIILTLDLETEEIPFNFTISRLEGLFNSIGVNLMSDINTPLFLDNDEETAAADGEITYIIHKYEESDDEEQEASEKLESAAPDEEDKDDI